MKVFHFHLGRSKFISMARSVTIFETSVLIINLVGIFNNRSI